MAHKRFSAYHLHLTARDITVLATIYEYGGVLTTVQLATLFWPPDVRRRLLRWGVSDGEAAQWLDRFGVHSVYDALTQLKWGLMVNGLRGRDRYYQR